MIVITFASGTVPVCVGVLVDVIVAVGVRVTEGVRDESNWTPSTLIEGRYGEVSEYPKSIPAHVLMLDVVETPKAPTPVVVHVSKGTTVPEDAEPHRATLDVAPVREIETKKNGNPAVVGITQTEESRLADTTAPAPDATAGIAFPVDHATADPGETSPADAAGV